MRAAPKRVEGAARSRRNIITRIHLTLKERMSAGVQVFGRRRAIDLDFESLGLSGWLRP